MGPADRGQGCWVDSRAGLGVGTPEVGFRGQGQASPGVFGAVLRHLQDAAPGNLLVCRPLTHLPATQAHHEGPQSQASPCLARDAARSAGLQGPSAWPEVPWQICSDHPPLRPLGEGHFHLGPLRRKLCVSAPSPPS